MTEPFFLTAKSILDTIESLKDKFPDPIYNSLEMNVSTTEIVKGAFKGISEINGGSILVGQFSGIPIYINPSIPDDIARFVASDGTTKDVYIGTDKE